MNLPWSTPQQMHIVWFITCACLGLLLGLWLGQWTSLHLISLLIVLLGIKPFWQRSRWQLPIVLLVAIVPGMLWAQSVKADIGRYSTHFGTVVEVKGIVADDPEYGQRGEQKFSITQPVIYGQNYPGQISVSTYSFHDISRGDTTVIKGKIRPGFGAKQAALSFAQIVSWQENHGLIDSLRIMFAAQVRSFVAEPMASLGLGFVVGQRSALPEQLDTTLKAVGLTHIVVASGYNLTILVRLARRLFEHVSAYLSLVAASGLMISFIALSGASPSLVRAGVVSSLGLLAWWYGRRFHPLVLILIAMTGTALWWPAYIWSDVGWWLSFLAFFGVLIMAPIIKKWLNISGIILGVMVETISATLMTLPLIIVVFNTVAPLAIPANILVVPLVPLAMLLTAVAAVGSALLPALGGFFSAPAQLILQIIVREAEWLASLQSPLEVQLDLPYMIGLYGVIIAGSLYLYHRLDMRGETVV